MSRVALHLSMATFLALPLGWWLGRDATRGAFLLTPAGRFAAVAAQRWTLLGYFRRFDMGSYRLQPLLVQSGSLSHDYEDYHLQFDAQTRRHHYGFAGTELTLATANEYSGAESYVFVKVPLWILLILAVPAPAMALRRTMIAHHRRRHGLCLRCGYNLRFSHDHCPECGTQRPDVHASSVKMS